MFKSARFCQLLLCLSLLSLAEFDAAIALAQSPHNVILFIPDGLRPESVNPTIAPTFARVRDQGVRFANSHSIFPTLTMVNSAAMGTSHFPGDMGNYANTVYAGFPVPSANGSVTPMIENDAIPLSAKTLEALQMASLPNAAPARDDNARVGDAKTPGTNVANVEQQAYFADVTTKAILPMFKATGKPFVLVFWSRDPDGTQHNQGDSLGQLVPGINGPTSQASIKNADDNLAAILESLKALGLDATTDVFVSSDHGFSTISKDSQTSAASKINYKDVPGGQLPPGFVAIDIAKTLNLPLFDPDAKLAPVDFSAGQHSSKANGLIGTDPSSPDVVVAANGGIDLVYLPKPNAKELGAKIVEMLLGQDYVSGLFVDDALGNIPGTLPLSAINFKGSSVTPVPAIVINFRSFAAGCGEPLMCAVTVVDHTLQQGQGMHGNFSRADTKNFMAAVGPDFRAKYADPAPASNADVGMTLAHILGFKLLKKGDLIGRVLTESLKEGNHQTPQVKQLTRISEPAKNGLPTVLLVQVVGNSMYFDAAGFPGRTVGLERLTLENGKHSVTASRTAPAPKNEAEIAQSPTRSTKATGSRRMNAAATTGK